MVLVFVLLASIFVDSFCVIRMRELTFSPLFYFGLFVVSVSCGFFIFEILPFGSIFRSLFCDSIQATTWGDVYIVEICNFLTVGEYHVCVGPIDLRVFWIIVPCRFCI